MDSLVFSYGIAVGLTVIILILNLILALKNFEKELNYSIVATGTLILVYFFGHISIYFAENVSEIIIGVKILNTSIFLAAIAFLIFSYHYVQSINVVNITVFSVIALFFAVINLVLPYSIMFSSIDLNFTFSGYWKKEYADIPGIRSIWQDLSLIYSVFYLGLIIYISTKIFRENRFSEGIQYISSLVIIIVAILIDSYIYNFHEELAFVAFLILLCLRLLNKLVSSFSVEEKLKLSEEKYKRFFENTAFGIYQTKLNGEILMLNPAGKRILAIPDEKNIYTMNSYSYYYHSADRDYFKNILLKEGEIENYEVKFSKYNGEEIYVREYARLVFGPNDTKFIEGAFEDVTEKKQSELLLIKAKDEAEKSNRLKSDFLAQMSHEIRSPISTILNFISLLKSNWDAKEYENSKEYFGIISSASKRITRTIDLILNMSQIQTKTYEPRYEYINLNDIISKLIAEYRQEAEQKTLNLEFNVCHIGSSVYGDEYTITQIFANLINNGIKYTDEGYLKIYFENCDNKITVVVEDTGKGIREEYKENIFEPFSQEEQGYSRKYDGNGLGLALVKQYCSLNHANISLESELGKGTKFKVDFNITESN